MQVLRSTFLPARKQVKLTRLGLQLVQILVPNTAEAQPNEVLLACVSQTKIPMEFFAVINIHAQVTLTVILMVPVALTLPRQDKTSQPSSQEFENESRGNFSQCTDKMLAMYRQI